MLESQLEPKETPMPSAIGRVLAKIERDSPPTQIDVTAASLERSLQREIDLRREERFFWVMVSVMLVDALIFQSVPWPGCIVLVLLQLILLAHLAKWLGVEQIAVPLLAMLNRYMTGKPEK
ncbi:MAG: hypothetical protein P0Y66_22070 [Candidatus Kaistia colombiensis]|nr:MAG: hypothetical protein P0Y66_22070 [Kaistia sp.]